MPNLYAIFLLARQMGKCAVSGIRLRPHSQQRLLLTALLLSTVLMSCASSLNYISGLYKQNPDRQVNVVVRVKDHNGIALTDLTLNDFYVRHNNKVLERKNNLRLNEKLSDVKLYLVVLIDQRENPGLKNSFERTREALKAYLTLQPKSMYIKLISYDTEARALNTDFSNDRKKLRALLQQLHTVEAEEAPALTQALALAQQSIESLPNGAYALNPLEFPASVTSNTETSPLYNSAILLMNHNEIVDGTLRHYANDFNFVVLDSIGSVYNQFSPITSNNRSTSPTVENDSSSGTDKVSTIFDVYKMPPGDLNKDIDQTKTIKVVNRAWDSLNNIVNGYYWLTYNKYTDFSTGEPNEVSVSLTQYGRSKDSGLLTLLGNQDLTAEGIVELTDEANQPVDPPLGELADVLPGLKKPESTIATNEILPPGITEPSIFAEVDGDLLSMLPAQHLGDEEEPLTDNALAVAEPAYPTESRVIADEPMADDFEILNSLNNTPADSGSFISDRDDTVPQFTAEPIQLVSAETSHELVKPEKTKEPTDLSNGRYIQVGAFIKLDNLYNVIDRLSGDYSVRIATSMVNGREYNRCIIGPFADEAATREALERLKNTGGLRDAFIIKSPLKEWIAN